MLQASRKGLVVPSVNTHSNNTPSRVIPLCQLVQVRFLSHHPASNQSNCMDYLHPFPTSCQRRATGSNSFSVAVPGWSPRFAELSMKFSRIKTRINRAGQETGNSSDTGCIASTNIEPPVFSAAGDSPWLSVWMETPRVGTIVNSAVLTFLLSLRSLRPAPKPYGFPRNQRRKAAPDVKFSTHLLFR